MLEQIKILRELTLPAILLRIFLSMLFSGILGYEREKKHRPAGFRTYIIVCLGSTLAMMTGLYISALTGSSDPARIPAQAISGIGFLGAGTILVTRQNRVRGLTTAAGLWAVACLGLSLGAGFYTGALIFFTAIWASIWILRSVDNRLTDHLKAVHLYVEFSKIEYISKFLSLARENNCTVNNLEISRTENDKKDESLSATMTMHFREAVAYSRIIETYGSLEGVIFIRKND